MKSIYSLLLGCAISLSAMSQTNTSTLTVILKGNTNQQLLIDGRDYSRGISLNDATVTINDLRPGQHDLQVIRGGYNYSGQYDVRSNFIIREDYDKTIVVSVNGSLQQTETRRVYGAGTKTPMADYQFRTLLQSVRNSRGYARRTRLDAAFSNSGYFFTTAQARQLLLLINNEGQRLELAKSGFDQITDQWNYRQLVNLFNRQANRQALLDYINSYRPDYGDNTGYNYPMTDASFNAIYRDVRNQYSGARVTVLTNIFNTTSNYFTTSQARQLLLLINSESDRLQLAKLSYRGITDRQNFSQVYDIFSSQYSRNELAAFVNSNGGTGGGGYYPRPAMTEATFNSLYRDVEFTFGLGAKMSRLTEIFNNSSYYFTTDQAEKLIRLVSSESNRLQLAKASYSHIVDPANFSQLYDMLDTQSSRNELDNYVRTNGRYNDGYGNNDRYPPIHAPMAAVNFDVLYRDISSRFGFGAKMSALNDVFANTENYFTVDQAEKLIRLVSDEDNRLQLAKASYRHLTDPENIADMYDMFSSQTSIDQLRLYIGSI